ncbi:GTP 3',8-cyclase [Parvicella tangerina]|uniref:GTP 3',8-cyclase n=1 Tax=Parvicella tangerina TaxID=2829795 RepID=A0A916JL48_9FLAO|nr:GTP 3',8-cyclase [Parvicella tangerina]
MFGFPITYHEPLFRPPSEGRSLIIQVTLGCSWNKCSFCEMYTSKHFTVRKQEDVFQDIEAFKPWADQITKVFLADGDPLVLSNKKLMPILEKINATFPNLRRISTYASPSNINRKSDEDLKELQDAGLQLLYVGIESGDDATLEAIQKGETFESTVTGINKAQRVGMDTSVMIITGVGGRYHTEQHAVRSAEVLNAIQPKFASTLVLTAHKGLEHYKSRFKGEFIELNLTEQLDEMKRFMEKVELKNTIFRSDHASNRLVLKGVLGKDKERFLAQIEQAIQDPYGKTRQVYGGY